ncbi:MAG TPA: aspartyl protease family protein [Terriglobales bacterium]|nr:aspartyl protease family protein [Terriglobales bacterium]
MQNQSNSISAPLALGLRRSLLLVFLALGILRGYCADSASPVGVIRLEPYLRAQAVVHAVVNGQPGTFMFDTGEGVTSFSPEFAEKIKCRPWGQISGFRMSGERLDNSHCDDVSFELSGHRFVAPVVGILDIMKFMGPDVPHIDGAIGLDLFARRIVTIIPRKSIVIESQASFAERIKKETELPIRIVRDVEGIALSVDGAVRTPQGTAWMELDTGNGGSIVVANHIAPLLGLKPDLSTPEPAHFSLANGVPVEGTARTRDLIMDGNIGAQFLNNWVMTLDLQEGRAWMAKTN